MQRLKDEFGCNSVDEAEAKLKKARDRYARLSEELEGMLDGLESSLDAAR